MRRIVMVIATAGAIAGSLAGAQTATAASTNTNTNSAASPARPTTPVPVITALDCSGTTGLAGCGPGWIWRDGWRGLACYPC